MLSQSRQLLHRTLKSAPLWRRATFISIQGFPANLTWYSRKRGCFRSALEKRKSSSRTSKKMELPEDILVGFGNPLLDITTVIEDNMLLEKYGLEANAAIIADEKHENLFEELDNMDNVQYSAGGACQNSLRVFQWIVGAPNRCAFFGAVGKDKFADRIVKRARADGVETHYQVKEELPTGTCAVIVSGQNRSLVANLGAAALFTEDYMDEEENCCVVDCASYFYVTGFFLAVSPDTVFRMAKLSSETNRTLILNLSAVFVLEMQKEQLDNIMPYVDIVIGNKEEILAFAETHLWNTNNIFEIGKQMQSLPKDNGRPRMVMVTDAVCPVLCFQENERILEYPVPKVDKKKVVDTNGCGDAFVGGFLSQLVQKMPLDYCIRTGIFASQQIIGVLGVTIDKLPKFTDNCI
ncbi:adenosine kinase [Drosophila miranda]|uniref:adenosine kinase n=1 Tax=Drosophila miranda TaxID=7229 RepID=UPI0007E6F8E1|nr:adenosine kinase [Drosophila miranda]